MKRLLVFIPALVMLSACSSRSTYTDSGNPGQIKAVIFYDDNKNGTMDDGETGVPARVGISQDASCPPSNRDKVTYLNTSRDGMALFANLKPGKYCVMLDGNYNLTTKLTQEVYVSSDETTTVMFGIIRE
jgi:uncharacterized protein (DUF2141 family)